MASSDAGTSLGRSEYDVFLSFRGPDTRAGFADLLCRSLTDAGISVFRDDRTLRGGEGFDESLLQGIDNSRIYIPIFSKGYASSQCCLRELAHIVESTTRSKGNKEILPIFYDVNPDDVKLKTPLYRDAILKLELEKRWSSELVDTWRAALTKVGMIKGWEVKRRGFGELILLIVNKIVEKLTEEWKWVERLVGIHDRVQAVIKLLDVDFGGVRLIKVYGMGGIGKTTLTKVVFDKLSFHFGKHCYFLKDVRANSSRTNGLVELQKKLLSQIGHPTKIWRSEDIDYGMERIGEALCDKKVLIILDDVDSSEQVEKLVGKSTLCSGSRVLISTRNKDVLQTYKPQYQILDYEMEVMRDDHALELFSWHAFHKDRPSNDYIDLSKEITTTTGRLPLALVVIGSFLGCIDSQELWKKSLEELKNVHPDDVFGKLMISYNALDFRQQQIFLDIACFFIGDDMTNALYMWQDCKFFPQRGVAVLIRLSLVKIVGNNTFWMHDQVRDLGREIVCSSQVHRRSRIWTCMEDLNATRIKQMNCNVEALSHDSYAQSFEDAVVLSEETGCFKNLRFLKLLGGTFAGDLANRFPNLRWISWYFPVRIYEWTNMYLYNVVVVEFTGIDLLDDSRLRDLTKSARKLKSLSLKSCHKITTTPDFSRCPALERLSFEDCSNLSRIDGSIGILERLIDLKIDRCLSLEDLPEEIGYLVNLKHFFVQQCKAKKLPDSIWKLISLQELHFSSSSFASTDSWELPSAIEMLHNLEVLLVNSRNLKGQVPSEIASLTSLRILNLSKTQVSELPVTISVLQHLQVLELIECHNIQKLPTLPTSLTHLQVSSATLWAVPNLSNLTNLLQLDVMIVDED